MSCGLGGVRRFGNGEIHDFFLPDVASEEHFHCGSEGDSEQSTHEAAKNHRPEQHRENDRHRVQSYRIADDFWRCCQRVDLLHHDEDRHDAEHVGNRLEAKGRGGFCMEPGNHAGGDEADDIADVGNDAENGHKDADEESVWQTVEGQGDTDEDAIDEADEHLATEEGDQVAIDLVQGIDEFAFEAGSFEWDVVVPMFLDAIAVLKEEKEVNGNHGKADAKADEAKDHVGAGRRDGHDFVLVSHEGSTEAAFEKNIRPFFGKGGDFFAGVIDHGQSPADDVGSIVDAMAFSELVDTVREAFFLGSIG